MLRRQLVGTACVALTVGALGCTSDGGDEARIEMVQREDVRAGAPLRVSIGDTVCGARAACPSPLCPVFVGARTGAAYLSEIRGGLIRFPGGRITKAGDGPRETRGVLDVDEASDGTVAVLSALFPRVDRISPSGATSREIVIPIAYGIAPQLADGHPVALMEGLARAVGDSTSVYVVRLAGNALDTVATFPFLAVRPMASSREMVRPAGLFTAHPVMSVSAAQEVFFSDGRHAEIHSRQKDGVGRVTYILPFTARPITSTDVSEATAVLERKTPSGRLAASWRADAARRSREAAAQHPVVLDIVSAGDRYLMLRVNAQETNGEAWAVLDRLARTVRLLAGEWTAVAGVDERGRILLCSEDEIRLTCGWSEPVLHYTSCVRDALGMRGALASFIVVASAWRWRASSLRAAAASRAIGSPAKWRRILTFDLSPWLPRTECPRCCAARRTRAPPIGRGQSTR